MSPLSSTVCVRARAYVCVYVCVYVYVWVGGLVGVLLCVCVWVGGGGRPQRPDEARCVSSMTLNFQISHLCLSGAAIVVTEVLPHLPQGLVLCGAEGAWQTHATAALHP